ncbi:MBG domain-containing protein [Levilactobacillus namurensis]|uniref:MBG domain-containing protein n=1 Tax=Levilactobacillus namurensis TaxID=380393 RepID=UPI001D896C87|nr:MBG domain-containing protein [Levilactobacillus namurensis]HJE44239.1 LPXTG cell wall anchor domain-containing protein [Levilactobacillus namurensis]
MKQRVRNQTTKKAFILYKGRTGWRLKTRIFGGLMIGLAAFTLADSGQLTIGHAATTVEETPATGTTVTPAKTSQSPNTRLATTEATTTGQTGTANSAPVTTASPNPVATPESAPVTESTPVTETTSTTPTTYPVLSQDQSVNIGVDQSQVSLTAQQIADHFTAKVENRGGSDQDDNPTQNTVTQKIGADGTINLTSNAAHDYYGAYGKTTIQGHQAAHVSFEHEIDFSHNFSMSGALGIGSKTSGGADSVGFIFAPGDPAKATQGGSGGQLGLGGLSNAFGFVFDEYNNVSEYHDPSSQPYIGWRTTDSNGNLQSAASTDWKAASQVGLNDRRTNTLNDFTMDYDAKSQLLTVVLRNGTFSRKIEDVSTGYSISVAASTGGSWNDYSARIDKFSYTPKTIPLTVHMVDSADQGALLDNANVEAIANIGDTVSVFSTQAAAQRAVAAGEVDPNLVSILPTDSAGNVYVIDGSQVVANQNGTAHSVGGSAYQDVADDTYYTYVVTDDDSQQVTVPVRLAYTAEVTPVDAQTQQPIAGLQPVTVTTVAGEPALVQIPGYTPTKVVLAAPKDGQSVAHDQLAVDQTTTAATDETTDTQAQALGHYYTSQGTTVDGQAVVGTATVGTGQAIDQALNQQPLVDANQQPVISGTATTGITNQDYYWSATGNAQAADSTDAQAPQKATNLLVPTTQTLKSWSDKASANQQQADDYQNQAREIYNQFSALNGLSQAQQADAETLYKNISDIYQDVYDSNAVAITDFGTAQTATVAADIVQDGQAGYAALKKAQDLLGDFEVSLGKLTTTNNHAQDSLATIVTQPVTYGQPVKRPTVHLGDGFGKTQADQLQDDDFVYYSDQDLKTPVTPVNAGTYVVKLTDKGRAYMKSLTPDNPYAGLFVSSILTINPKTVTAQADPSTVVYGDAPVLSGTYGQVTDTTSGDFEVVDPDTQQVVTDLTNLQVGPTYQVRYTAQAQAKLAQAGNYAVTGFTPGALTVTPRAITVSANNHTKTYGTADDPELDWAITDGQLQNGDQLEDLGVTLTRTQGEAAGDYQIKAKAKATNATNANYAVNVTPGTFTIAQRNVTLTIQTQHKFYGDADPTPDLELAAGTSLAPGDQLEDLNLQFQRDQGEAAWQKYAINGKADNANYNITIQSGYLSIDPRPVIVTAAPQEKVYGDADPSLTLTPDAQNVLVAGDSLDALGVTLSRVAGETVTKDGYEITGNLQSSNYAVTVTPATLMIRQKPVTVQIRSQQKTYGDVDPAPVIQLDGDSTLVAGDTLADLGVQVTRASGEDVGTYQLSDQSTNHNPNYKLTVTPGTLKILPKAATATITALKAVYGNPVTLQGTSSLPGKFAHFQPTDLELVDQAGQVVLPTKIGAGTYTIRLTAVAKQRLQDQANYYLDKFPVGQLVVTPRPVTLQIEDQQKFVGEADPQEHVRVTAGSLAETDTVDDLGLMFALPEHTAVGTYPITATAKTLNYLVRVVPGQLKVLGRTVDALGDVTTTEKAASGEVVNVTEQWPDHSVTVYTYDPATRQATVSELVQGKVVKTQPVNLQGETIVNDGTGALTVLDIHDLTQPVIAHYPAQVWQPATPDQLAGTTGQPTGTGASVTTPPMTPEVGTPTVDETPAPAAEPVVTPKATAPTKTQKSTDHSRGTVTPMAVTDASVTLTGKQPSAETVAADQSAQVPAGTRSTATATTATNHMATAQLPQTDEQSTNWLTILGGVLLAAIVWPIGWLRRH